MLRIGQSLPTAPGKLAETPCQPASPICVELCQLPPRMPQPGPLNLHVLNNISLFACVCASLGGPIQGAGFSFALLHHGCQLLVDARPEPAKPSCHPGAPSVRGHPIQHRGLGQTRRPITSFPILPDILKEGMHCKESKLSPGASVPD